MYQAFYLGELSKEHETIFNYLQKRGLQVSILAEQESSIMFLEDTTPDVIIIEEDSSIMGSSEMKKWLKLWTKCPVVFFQKEVSMTQLFQNIVDVLIQKNDNGDMQFLTCQKVMVCPETREVIVDGQSIVIANKEYQLLVYLLENKNKVLTRDSILNHIWGMDFYGEQRVVDNHIKKLRKHLGEQGKIIKTIFKIGYSIKEVNLL